MCGASVQLATWHMMEERCLWFAWCLMSSEECATAGHVCLLEFAAALMTGARLGLCAVSCPRKIVNRQLFALIGIKHATHESMNHHHRAVQGLMSVLVCAVDQTWVTSSSSSSSRQELAWLVVGKPTGWISIYAEICLLSLCW
jgi:uncharacterized protein YfiM (DUF2279 family)